MEDKSAAVDEARRVAQHRDIKSDVQRDVNADLAARSGTSTSKEEAALDRVATGMRDDAIGQVASKDREVSRARGIARGAQMVDYGFFLLYGVLAVRLALAMIAASPSNGFVRFIAAVTDPFYALFRGIVPSQSLEGGFTLVVPIIVAIVAYALLHAAIKGLMRVVAQRKTEL